MTKELNNLLSLIFQDGRTKIENGSLLVPPGIAKRFGDQIRRFKPEIMIALGHCPICASKLIVETEHRTRLSDQKKQTGIATYCALKGHFDKWEF